VSEWKLLVEVDAGGAPLRFAQEEVDVVDSQTGRRRSFLPALSSLSVPAMGVDQGEATFEVPSSVLDATALQGAGVFLPGAPAWVWLWKAGTDWRSRKPLLVGQVAINGVGRSFGSTQVRLVDGAYKHDPPFPPYTMELTEFPYLSPSAAGTSFPVLYGRHKLAVLVLVGRMDDTMSASSTVRFVVAGHRIASKRILVKPGGGGDQQFWATVQTKACGTTGATYSYVDAPYSAVRGGSTFVAEVDGYADERGDLVQGLGDAFVHALNTFSDLPNDRIDWERVSKFQARANKYTISSAFGGSHGETFVATWKSRMEAAFPVLISWRGGRLGADVLTFDQSAGVGRGLRAGAELLGRHDPVQPDQEEIFTSFRCFYAPNTLARDEHGNPRRTASLSRDYLTDQRCAQARSLFGESVCPPKQVFEVNAESAAAAILDGLVDTKGVLRTPVTYAMSTDLAMGLSLFDVRYPLSDDEETLCWDREHFRLERLALRVDDPDLCDATFRSFRGNRRAP